MIMTTKQKMIFYKSEQQSVEVLNGDKKQEDKQPKGLVWVRFENCHL